MIWELCRQEAIKLFTQKYPYFLLGLILVVQAGVMIFTATTPPETTLDVVTGPQLFAKGAGWGLQLGFYLILVIGAMGFSQEFSLGTVKTVLVLPVRRYQWVAAKILFLVMLAAVLLLAVTLLAALIVALTLGWGDVVIENQVLFTAGVVRRQVLVAIALTLVFLLPVCAFGLLVGLFFNSSGAAVGTALMLGIVAQTAVGLFGEKSGKYFFFFHLFRPISNIERMGKLHHFQWEPVLTWGLGSTLISFAVFTAWIILKMERMDISG